MAQYIYTMIGVSKIVPPNRTIIKDISLSFFPGAKIGLLGLNGAGKSTVLRIMAGVDTDFDGEARPQPGIRIGYLPQEPELDDSKTVRQVVEEGVVEVRDLLNRFDEISMKFAEPMDDDAMNTLLGRTGRIAGSNRKCQRLGTRAHARNCGRCPAPARMGRIHAPPVRR